MQMAGTHSTAMKHNLKSRPVHVQSVVGKDTNTIGIYNNKLQRVQISQLMESSHTLPLHTSHTWLVLQHASVEMVPTWCNLDENNLIWHNF